MLSGRITDGSEFVVFDMEWNQPLPGKQYPFEVSTLTGEIIEIGAVKYRYDNGALSKLEVFSEDISPKKYTKIHFHVKKVTGKTTADLSKGDPFEKVAARFLNFIESADVLVGWGESDPAMLKMNLAFFGMPSELGVPFLDLQPVFSLFSGQQGQQRSVEAAVDYYGIEKNDIFHSATSDAVYTGEIFEQIFEHNKPNEVLSAISSSAVNPDIKRDYSYVGRAYDDANQALADTAGFNSMCPVCGKKLDVKIESFRIRKSVYELAYCREHGEIFIRTRIKRNKEGKRYAASVMRIATQNDYFLVASKKEEFDKYGTAGKVAEPDADGEDSTKK